MRTLEQTIADRNNNFNLIRLILSASVIYFHSFALADSAGHTEFAAYYLLSPMTDVGGLAVEIFFFLSGLFVSHSFNRDRNTVDFLLKRFARLWPGLFVCLVVTTTIACVITRGSAAWTYLHQSEAYAYITNNAIFRLRFSIPDVFLGHRYTAINGSIHTLPLEVKMYGVLAVAGTLGFLSSRKLMTFFGLVMLALDLIYPRLFTVPFDVIDYGQKPIGMFFLGVVACGLSNAIQPRLWQALAIATGMMLVTGAERTLLFFLLAAWLSLYLGQTRWLTSTVRLPNDYSYGLYIYGWPCQQMVVAAHPQITPYALAVSATLLATLFAVASWHLVEKPAIGIAKEVIVARRRLCSRLPGHRLLAPFRRERSS